MKVMVATAALTLLILMGWDRPYQEQFAAFSAAYGQTLQRISAQQPQTGDVATIPLPTPQPDPIPVDTGPVPAVPQPHPIAGGKDNSWMWTKGGTLDNPRQDGVDRAGVHTFEPMLQNTPPPR